MTINISRKRAISFVLVCYSFLFMGCVPIIVGAAGYGVYKAATKEKPPEGLENYIEVSPPSGPDVKLMRAGREKARESGYTPIPFFIKEDGTIEIVQLETSTIRKGINSLVNGDMIINVGEAALQANDLTLQRGDFAVVEDGRLRKGGMNLTSYEEEADEGKTPLPSSENDLSGDNPK